MSFFLGIQHIELDKIIVLERARKDLGDIDQLCDSIKKLGLLQAICVHKEGTEYHLVDGQRRMLAYKKLGHNTIPAMVYNFDDMTLEGEYDANVIRKNFTPSEAVALAEKIKTAVENRARLRQHNAWMGDGAKLAQDPEVGKKTRDIVAKAVGYSHETLKKASEVVKAAESDPANEDLIEKMDETGKVSPVFRELQERKLEANTEAKKTIIPMVFMPNGNIHKLTHLASDKFSSGNVLAWVTAHLQFPDGCDILIQRRGNDVFIFTHQDLSLPPDVRLCSTDAGEVRNGKFLVQINKIVKDTDAELLRYSLTKKEVLKI